MIRLFNLFVLLLLTILVLLTQAACTRRQGNWVSDGNVNQDGVQVGNGVAPKAPTVTPAAGESEYLSKTYRLHLKYASTLEFSEKSAEVFSFREPKSNSVGEYEVIPSSIALGKDSRAALREMAAAKHPAVTFQDDDVNGLIAISANQGAVHFVATPRRDVVWVQSQLRGGDSGKSISDIVRTLYYDGTPPEISSVIVEKDSAKRGGTLRLQVSARDIGVGMGDGFYGRMIALQNQQSPCVPEALFRSKLVHQRNSDYVVSIPLSETICPGAYVFTNLSFFDRVGNATTLRGPANGTNGIDVRASYVNSQPIPVVTLTVTMPGALDDVVAPKISKVVSSVLQVRAGEMAEVKFAATDESGISLDEGYWGEWVPVQNHGRRIRAEIRGAAERVKDDEYKVTYRVSPWIPGGDYFLQRFYVRDRSAMRNLSELFTQLVFPFPAPWEYRNSKTTVPTITIANDPMRFDAEPPMVSGLRFEKSRARPGSVAHVRFEAFDGLSGVADNDKTLGVLTPMFTRPYYVPRLRVRGPLQRNRDGSFLAPIEVPLDAEPGRYYLTFFQVEDRAENLRRYLVGNPTLVQQVPSGPHFYSGVPGNIEPIPVGFLEIAPDALN